MALDLNGNGELEIAVGAWGEGIVYVFFGPYPEPGKPAYSEFRLFDVQGPMLCPVTAADDRLGYDVTAGQLDADGGRRARGGGAPLRRRRVRSGRRGLPLRRRTPARPRPSC